MLMGRSLSLAIVVLLLSGGVAGVSRAPETGGMARSTDDVFWFGDHRITQNAAADECPELFFENGWYCHLVWERGGSSQMYKMFGADGNTTVSEKLVANATTPRQLTGQPATRLALSHDGLYTFWFDSSSAFVVCRAIGLDGRLGSPVDLRPLKSGTRVACLPVGWPSYSPIFAYEAGNGKIATATYDGQYLTQGLCATVPGQGVVLGIDGLNDIHLFHRSTTKTGLYHTKLRSNGTMCIDTHWIDTDVAGYPPNIAMPRVAFDSAGSIHLLQSSAVNGQRSLWYTKLDRNGEKLTKDIWICGTAADFGDIDIDSLGNAHVVWGDAGDGQIHHLKIRPGTENGSWAPAAITSSAVNAHDPDLEVGYQDRLGLVWVDERNGNPQIYWKMGESPGVEMEQIADMSSIRPNETRSANLTLQNTGAVRDTMQLTLDVDFCGMPGGIGRDWNGTGWKVWLPEDRVIVEGQDWRHARINVRGPSDGNQSARIKVRVNVSSGLDPLKRASVQFLAYFLEWKVGFKIACPDSFMEITNGSAWFEISMTNTGEVNLTLELNATSSDDWSYALDRDRVLLRDQRSETVYLTVMPPADLHREDAALVYVNARSADDPSVSGFVATLTEFQVRPSLAMWVDTNEAEVNPGGTAVFNITAANTDGNASDICMRVKAAASDSGWKVGVEGHGWYDYVGQIHYGQNVTLLLEVTAPAGAQAGRRVQIDVAGTDDRWGLWAAVSVNVTVRQVHNLSLAIEPGAVEILPGERAIFDMEISNRGNGPEELELHPAALPAGWTQSFEQAAGNQSGGNRLVLEAGRTVRSWITVHAPLDALAGAYKMNWTLVDREGLELLAAADIRVGQVFSVDLAAADPVGVAFAGNATSIALDIVNKGNDHDTVLFEFQGLPASWVQRHIEDSSRTHLWNLSLGPGEKAIVFASVVVPPDFLMTRMDFSVRAVSESGASDSVKLGIDVLQVNLVAVGIEWSPALPVEGQDVTLTVRVANRGTLDAENVRIRLWEGSGSLGLGTLERIPAGDVRSLQFSWRPKAGAHLVLVDVDPAGTVRETDERDNRLQRTVLVSEKAPEPAAATGNYWNVAVALVVLAAVAGLVVVLRKRRSQQVNK